MEALFILLALYLFLVLIVLPIWTIVKVRRHNEELEALHQRLHRLEGELTSLQTKVREGIAPAPLPGDRSGQTPGEQQPTTVHAKPAAVTPPPVVAAPPAAPAPRPKPVPEPPALPPVIATPVASVPARPVYTPSPPKPAINWEQFMGAKLFAWLGGLALFLGVAFFVKYSFEHDLIPPAVRAALGFLVGAGLIVGGLKIPREKYAITSQTLIATGVVSLYIVTFA